ncbi:MAG: Rrf2 family transcriptional regulator [Thermoleophilaceae bacterium]|nr:Rrf2 family transcriptional regulator [Thermoleophilaceae bacterium]
MRLTAKADYAVRAAVELAAADGGTLKRDALAGAQDIPAGFLENILLDLRQSDIVRSQRGPEGGYWLARPAADITVADIVRAVEGPLASVRGERPGALTFRGTAQPLEQLWVAVRASLRSVLESVTLADLAEGELPEEVAALTRDPDAWVAH